MYAVVGCNECGNMWLVTDPRTSETANCSRCGKTHRTAKLKTFFESDDRTAAQQARSALLAKKHGDSAEFADVAHVAELEEQVDEAGVDDADYLAESGLDANEVFAAGERAAGGGDASRSQDEIVRDAVSELSAPTEEAVVEYATDRGVPADRARELLDRLVRGGEASESGGEYRLL
ncbi:DUF5817 domain-containing protein [Haloparvum sp. PAK95]|uniref:DUF5817 domain-containing protein n=1 Tax=Haloparvum sp. PAK95 TaxID=3418962 RepID=UPI003D2EB32D